MNAPRSPVMSCGTNPAIAKIIGPIIPIESKVSGTAPNSSMYFLTDSVRSFSILEPCLRSVSIMSVFCVTLVYMVLISLRYPSESALFIKLFSSGPKPRLFPFLKRAIIEEKSSEMMPYPPLPMV